MDTRPTGTSPPPILPILWYHILTDITPSMKQYSFPVITHIDDVLPHIEGRSEFRVVRKDWYTVINYVVAMADTFPSPEVSGGNARMRLERQVQATILRECRGLIFDSESGKLLSRPYHKFFNVGEKPETHPNRIDLTQPHVILEKLDGSMIRPIPVPGSGLYEFRLGSKMGVTDVAMNAEVWMANRPNYVRFVKTCLEHNITPIFEWCSRKNRIVVDYPEDRLVLTAMRQNNSGWYLPYQALKSSAREDNIDLVRVINPTTDGDLLINELVDNVREWEGEEGVVVRFDASRPHGATWQGHMVKIKADAYIVLHRSKDAISSEKNVIEVIVNSQVDDLIPILTESDAKRLRDFQRAFWLSVDDVASEMVDVYLDGGVGIDEQKDFAQRFVQSLPKHLHPFMYGLRKGRSAWNMLVKSIAKSVSTQNKIDSSRWMWGGLRWVG